jgi:iron complex transport system permease protein
MRATPASILLTSTALFLFLAATAAVSIFIGTAHIGVSDIIPILFSGENELPAPLASLRTIVLQIRVPRIIMAAVVGAALSICGAVLQALLRNPLAEPYILGISSGAAVGAVGAILLGLGGMRALLPAVAFFGAVGTLVIVFAVAKVRERIYTHTLLLAGVVTNAFFTAVVMFMVSITSDERIHGILFWLMGDFGFSNYAEVAIALPLVAGGFLIIFLHARPLNLIVTGEDTALQMGVEVERVKKILLICSSLVTAAAVSFTGVVGFTGLMVPHMVRMVIGSDHRLVLPASLLFGGAFMIIADAIARSIIAPTELPVGVITALLGAPFFIYLLGSGRA